MGRNNSSSLADQRCKKHPSHKQSKGVCPSCLREKLSHLLSSSSSSNTNHSNSSSTCSSLSPCSLSDSNLTSPGSPLHHHHHHHQQHKSFSFVFSGGKALKKSRSLVFVEKMKKKGFLSKLIGRRKERDAGELLHSKTLKERSSTNKWALFS